MYIKSTYTYIILCIAAHIIGIPHIIIYLLGHWDKPLTGQFFTGFSRNFNNVTSPGKKLFLTLRVLILSVYIIIVMCMYNIMSSGKKVRIRERIRLEINHFKLHQNAVDHNIHIQLSTFTIIVPIL